ncbi:MAG: hypothetical protein ACYDA8_01425 [Deferrisomatales bacterium]
MLNANEIGKALEHASFPIRSFAELHDALHRHLDVGEHVAACQIDRMERLFSPRDFLFTNAEQVRAIVQARQCLLADEGR